MFTTFEKKWITIDENNYNKVELKPIAPALLRNISHHFPKGRELTQEEEILLSKLESQQSKIGEEYLRLFQLRCKQGISKSEFAFLYQDLQTLIIEVEKMGLSLPKEFVRFFSTYQTLKRFRLGDISFSLRDGVLPFSNDDNFCLIPFLGNSQGFCWWAILINRENNYCIVYRDIYWTEGLLDGDIEENAQYFICSDTFEEFLLRFSEDSIKKEQQKLF